MQQRKKKREKDKKRITNFLVFLLVKDKLCTARVRIARSEHSRHASEGEKRKRKKVCTVKEEHIKK